MSIPCRVKESFSGRNYNIFDHLLKPLTNLAYKWKSTITALLSTTVLYWPTEAQASAPEKRDL